MSNKRKNWSKGRKRKGKGVKRQEERRRINWNELQKAAKERRNSGGRSWKGRRKKEEERRGKEGARRRYRKNAHQRNKRNTPRTPLHSFPTFFILPLSSSFSLPVSFNSLLLLAFFVLCHLLLSSSFFQVSFNGSPQPFISPFTSSSLPRPSISRPPSPLSTGLPLPLSSLASSVWWLHL